jgi:hypothetical protein
LGPKTLEPMWIFIIPSEVAQRRDGPNASKLA